MDFDWFGPYTIKYQNKDLLMKNEEYGDVPLYIEHMSMSEEDLSEIMDEYEKIRVEHFQYSDFYLSRLKHHLTPKNLVKIPPKELFVKAKKAIQWLPASIKNMQKERFGLVHEEEFSF